MMLIFFLFHLCSLLVPMMLLRLAMRRGLKVRKSISLHCMLVPFNTGQCMQHTAEQCNVGYFSIQADSIFGTSNRGQRNFEGRTTHATACSTLQATVMLGTLQYRLMQYFGTSIQGSELFEKLTIKASACSTLQPVKCVVLCNWSWSLSLKLWYIGLEWDYHSAMQAVTIFGIRNTG